MQIAPSDGTVGERVHLRESRKMKIKRTLSLSIVVVVAVAACSQPTLAGGTPLTTIKVTDAGAS